MDIGKYVIYKGIKCQIFDRTIKVDGNIVEILSFDIMPLNEFDDIGEGPGMQKHQIKPDKHLKFIK